MGEAFADPLKLAYTDPAFIVFVHGLLVRYLALGNPFDVIVARFKAAAAVLQDVTLFKNCATHLSKGLSSLHTSKMELMVPLFSQNDKGKMPCHPVVYSLNHNQHAILDFHLDAG